MPFARALLTLASMMFLVTPSATSVAAAPADAERVLREVVLPERAVDDYPLAATASCRRAGDDVRCNVRTATIDGDVTWEGDADVAGTVWREGSEKYRYRITGTKTLCAPGGGCNERSFTWKGRGCGTVVNGKQGDGEGAAGGIHAIGLGCRGARRVARRHLCGTTSAWRTDRRVAPPRTGLRSGDRRLSLMLAGGRGC
jgi:hypothetical protein